ncbi:unnamed protein product [Caenorhabditis angaria]|uniref:Uncharacterized protein n=1 Tax=Caenorhabditis angaria TaxID=860376 RepID=A0A9P1IXE3_9PELO|nr:unnamed protein product [Caenorhabditis angaria]
MADEVQLDDDAHMELEHLADLLSQVPLYCEHLNTIAAIGPHDFFVRANELSFRFLDWSNDMYVYYELQVALAHSRRLYRQYFEAHVRLYRELLIDVAQYLRALGNR